MISTYFTTKISTYNNCFRMTAIKSLLSNACHTVWYRDGLQG